jgi:hypothetical protein
MSTAVRLIPLQCSKCQTAVPGQPGEVAWVCAACGQALLLDEEKGVRPIDAFFSQQIAPNQPGKPYWVALGTVSGLNRQTYRGDESRVMAAFWSAPRLFYVPAWKLAVEDVVRAGVQMLTSPVSMQAGGRAAFYPVTVSPKDLQPLAEFMVMSVEAARKDYLKEINFSIRLEAAQLWVLP